MVTEIQFHLKDLSQPEIRTHTSLVAVWCSAGATGHDLLMAVTKLDKSARQAVVVQLVKMFGKEH